MLTLQRLKARWILNSSRRLTTSTKRVLLVPEGILSKSVDYTVWVRPTLQFGSRDRAAARKLWNSLPPVYRQCATCYTDFWEAYQGILPTKRHQPVIDAPTAKST